MLTIEYSTEDAVTEDVQPSNAVLSDGESIACAVDERKTIEIRDNDGGFVFEPHSDQCSCCAMRTYASVGMLRESVDAWEGFEPTTQPAAEYLFYDDDEVETSSAHYEDVQVMESNAPTCDDTHDQKQASCETDPASPSEVQPVEVVSQVHDHCITLPNNPVSEEIDVTTDSKTAAGAREDGSFVADQVDPVSDSTILSCDTPNTTLPSLIPDESGESSDLSLLTECNEPPRPEVKSWFSNPPPKFTVWELEYASWHQAQSIARGSLPLEDETYIGLMRCRQAGSEPPSMRFLDHAITALKAEEEPAKPERSAERARVYSSLGMLELAIATMRASNEERAQTN